MARGEAYCVELGADISLQEAHTRFFEQPEAKRKRFTFMCGDPKCRAIARPKVVGAVYDRPDAFDAEAIESGRHRAPYFRSHVRFPHIDDCTWHESPSKDEPADDPGQEDSVVNVSELGLIWLPEARKRAPRKFGSGDDHDSDDDESATDHDSKRADSTRYLATVGMSYLTMTVDERKNIPLKIGRGGGASTFYSTCLPITAHHPAYRTERIYHGQASIAELDNVFVLTFRWKFSPAGSKATRDTIAKVKFLKRTLDEEDRHLGEVLNKAVTNQESVYCFVYVTDPPELRTYGDKPCGWLQPAKRDHIFIVPESLITRKDSEQT
ncbi:hypothetical protein SAMN02787142_3055 [Burkholderia sp. WP9]|nr:hypothetical protein SAMN02787142_3055 [Burkholderia sp. WP9]